MSNKYEAFGIPCRIGLALHVRSPAWRPTSGVIAASRVALSTRGEGFAIGI